MATGGLSPILFFAQCFYICRRTIVFSLQKVFFLLFFVFVSSHLRAQIVPRDNSSLNYRIIGFSFPADNECKSYRIEIASGDYNTEDSFIKNIILSPVSKTNRLIAEVPAFGSKYTWRIIYAHKKNDIQKSAFYHFSTNITKQVDTTFRRLNIIQQAGAYKDAYVALDGGGVIYDMKGNPVWYLPDPGASNYLVGDMKLTPQGTITYIVDQACYEVNYNGQKLWQAPTYKADTGTGFYHHEFTRLANGHYMVLGTEFVWYSRTKTKDSSYMVVIPDTVKHDKYSGAVGSAFIDSPGAKNRGRYGTIIELDKNGKIVWYWKSSKYLLASDYVNYWPQDMSKRYEPHENAFWFDEKNKAIYLSYRNLSRIIKIDYPSGNVLHTYGEIYKRGSIPKENSLFCNQHSVRRSADGNIYFFNNNYCHGSDSDPSIMMLKDAVSEKDTTETVWEYKCSRDKYTRGFYSGGIGMELPDRSMFICLGSDYAKLMIVSREKKILWSALPETYSNDRKTWEPTGKIYRANIISRKDLERMIWAGTTQNH